MIKISRDDLEYLEKHNIDISEKIEKNDIRSALDIIDDAILDDIVDHDDEPSERGLHLQRIYDRIMSENIS